jgi:hypothetical protein
VRFNVTKIISVAAGVMFTCVFIFALFFGEIVRRFYPDFSTMLFVSFVIFFAGMAYAIIERNLVIGILTILVTMLIPLITKNFMDYWESYLKFLYSFF